MRYTSHLDLQKVWVRALLRAKLPLAYTQGFHPVPKVGYAWPLPLGWGTEGELIDIWLDIPEDQEIQKDEFITSVNKGMPDGLKINNFAELPYSDPALTIVIQSALYRILFPRDTFAEEVQAKMEALCAQEKIERERRGKIYDLKPLIESWQCGTDEEGRACMEVQMAARDSAMGRPDELTAALGYDPFAVNYVRLSYILKEDAIRPE